MRSVKTYLIFAMLLAVGCTGHEEYSPDRTVGPKELKFAISSLETRGKALLSVEDITSMGVFAYSTGTSAIPEPVAGPDGSPVYPGWSYPANLLENQRVTKDVTLTPNQWSYDPTAFWPLDPAVNNTFFAYSPHSSEFAAESYAVASVPAGGGAPTLRYTLPENIADQKDILYAKPVYNVNLDSGEVDRGMVEYQMEHAMTWLAFVMAPTSALGPGDDPASRETYSTNRLIFMADNLPLTSTLDLETGLWGEPTSHGNVQWDIPINLDNTRNIAPRQTARLTDESNRMILFPVDIARGMANIELTFYYNKNGDSYDRSTGRYDFSLPIPETRMQPGKVVVYLINISIEGAWIEFMETNKIDPWLDGGTIGGADDNPVEMF